MLKSEKVKLIIETSGALAVLLGLVFVGFELRQNTKAVESATFQSLTDASNDYIMSIAADAELTRIRASGVSDASSLSEEEYQRFFLTQRSFWVRMQNVYSQWKRGTLTHEDWQLYKNVICIEEDDESGVVATFHEHQIILSEDFQRFVRDCWKAQLSSE